MVLRLSLLGFARKGAEHLCQPQLVWERFLSWSSLVIQGFWNCLIFSRFGTNLSTSPALRMKNGNTWIYLMTYWSFIDLEGFIQTSFFSFISANPDYLLFLQFHVNLSPLSGIYKWRLRSPLPRLVGKLLMQVLNKNLMAESIVDDDVVLNPPPKQWQGRDLQSSKSLSSPPVITLACKDY